MPVRKMFWPSVCVLGGIVFVIAAAGCGRGTPSPAPRADAPPKADPAPPGPAYREVAVSAGFNPGEGADELSWDTHIDSLGRVDQQAHDPNPRVIGENFRTRSLPQLDPQRLEALVGRIERSGFFELRNEYPTEPVLPRVGPTYTLSAQFEKPDGTFRHHLVLVTGDGGNHPDVARFRAAWKAVLDAAPPPTRPR